MIAVAVAVGVGVAAWTALVLATLGYFVGAIGAVLALLAGLGSAALVVRRARRGGFRPPRASVGVGALGLALLGGALLLRPHEYILGGLDPGVYVNTAALIATEGGLVWRDLTLAALPDEEQAALFREPAGPLQQGSRLLGFYLTDLAAGRVIPHGMHLFPSAMAIGMALGGVGGALNVPGLLTLSAALSLAVLGRRWSGPLGGAVAAALFLLGPAVTWFGRYPAAETMALAALFGGLLVAVLAFERDDRVLAALGGALVGQTHLAKIESFPLLVALAAVAGWIWVRRTGRPVHGAALAGYGASLAHALLHVGVVATYYASTVYGRHLPGMPWLGALLAGAVIVSGLVIARPAAFRRMLERIVERRDLVWRSGAIVVVLALLYGWLLRPLDLFGEVNAAPEALRFAIRNRIAALPRLGWYVPPLAIVTAVGGALIAARGWPVRPSAATRERPGRAESLAFADAPVGDRIVLAVLGLTLMLEAVVVLWDPRITAEYPWAARRWVPLLVPGLSLFAGCLVGWLWRGELGARAPAPGASRLGQSGVVSGDDRAPTGVAGLPGRRVARVAAVLLTLGALIPAAAYSMPLLAHREYTGATALVAGIAGRVPPHAVLLYDDDLVGWRFSAPLQFLAEREGYILFGEAGRDEGASAPLRTWREQERPLLWLRIGEPASFERFGFAWRPIETWRTALPEVVPTTDAPPREVRLFAVPITLYGASAR